MLRGLLVVLALSLLAFVPSVSAQEPGDLEHRLELEIHAADEALVPGAAPVAVPFVGRFMCGAAEPFPISEYVIDLRVASSAPWVWLRLLTTSWTVQATPADCVLGTVFTLNGTVEVNVSVEAPARVQVPIELWASFPEEREAVAVWNATVGTLLHVEVTLPHAVWKTGPGSRMAIPVSIVNGGNGDIEVALSAPDAAPLAVQAPGAAWIEAGDRSMRPVEVRAPATSFYMNEHYDMTIVAVVTSPLDPSVPAETHRLEASVQVQGATAEAPAPGLPLLLLAVLVLAVARRRLVQQ